MWSHWQWVLPALAVLELSDIASAVRRLARAMERRSK